jgi:plastocyanin
MKKVLLHALVILVCLACSIKDEPITKNVSAWTVSNSSYTFNPSVLTITQGDHINFNIDKINNVVEVSRATWNANGNDILAGFSLPFGGGTIQASQLSIGTHYYVSSLHSTLGMKGVIIVKQ